jgi:hypothetical protein
VTQRQIRQRRALKKRQDLRHYDHAMAIPSIHEHARERRDDKRRNLRREAHDAEHGRGLEHRVAFGDPVNQPAGRGCGEPRSNQRNALAKEEKSIVAVLQRPQQELHPRGPGVNRSFFKRSGQWCVHAR